MRNAKWWNVRPAPEAPNSDGEVDSLTPLEKLISIGVFFIVAIIAGVIAAALGIPLK